MEEKTYYVSVQAGTVLDDQGASAYEFEIRCSPEQAEELQAMMEQMGEQGLKTVIPGMMPAIPYHQDPENDAYDTAMSKVYRRIYELGTPETRKHIESMGIIAPS